RVLYALTDAGRAAIERAKATPSLAYVDLFEGYLRAIGISRNVRWHDLRHTAGSSLVSGWWGRRWTLEEVQEYLGHESIDATKRYAHIGQTALKKAVAETSGLPTGGHHLLPAALEATLTLARKYRKSRAPAAGLEPATRRLTAACSTN